MCVCVHEDVVYGRRCSVWKRSAWVRESVCACLFCMCVYVCVHEDVVYGEEVLVRETVFVSVSVHVHVHVSVCV